MRRQFLPLLAALLLLPVSGAEAIDGHAVRVGWAKRERQMGSKAGAYVVNLTTGKVIFQRNASKRLAPASNEKLLTTAATLLKLDPDDTLTTTVRAEPGVAVDEDGVLDGDLYLVGAGDPYLNDVAMKDLATQLKGAAGVRRITGAIVGDGSLFDGLRGSYDSGFAYDPDLGGELGGLTWGHGRFDAQGPSHVAAARLRFFLAKANVKVTKQVKVAALPEGAAQQLAAHDSPTIAQLVSITNHPSDNFYAETLIKLLGARFGGVGSTKAGLEVAREALDVLGVHPTMRDGSGLSRADRVSPRELVRLLKGMHARPEGLDFRASLAAPGEWGTLSARMTSTAARGRCRAKTGTLIGVSALSGYCTAANGNLIAFSLLENGVCAVCAKRLEDQMVPLLARYTGETPE